MEKVDFISKWEEYMDNTLYSTNLVYRDEEWSIQKGGFPAGIWHNCKTIGKLPASYSPFLSDACRECKKEIPNHLKITAILIASGEKVP